MFYVHCYVCRGNTKCDEMKSSRRQPMKTEERQKKRKKKVFAMGTGGSRCEYSALYGRGQQTWSRLVEMGELCNLLILCWLLCSRQGQGIPRWRKEMCKRCE